MTKKKSSEFLKKFLRSPRKKFRPTFLFRRGIQEPRWPRASKTLCTLLASDDTESRNRLLNYIYKTFFVVVRSWYLAEVQKNYFAKMAAAGSWRLNSCRGTTFDFNIRAICVRVVGITPTDRWSEKYKASKLCRSKKSWGPAW